MNLLHRRLSVSYAAVNSWLSMDEIGHKEALGISLQSEVIVRRLNTRYTALQLTSGVTSC